ncbi:MAG: hypothetical protein C0507_03440 [Cyanobacteria bacterium PR.3.49]|nr:hypothetical protein [Cyanobacteria bacterium PR.3.49]
MRDSHPDRQKLLPESGSNLLRLILNYFANPVHLKFQKLETFLNKNSKSPPVPETFAKMLNKA